MAARRAEPCRPLPVLQKKGAAGHHHSAPRGFPPTRGITTTARPCFPSGCCSPPCGTTSPCLGKPGKLAPALADLCDIRAALGRERWRKAGRHLCAAAWLGEQTPTDKLLEKAVDDWNSPTDMKLIIQAWSGGGRIVPKRLWRKPDAIRCWAARRTEAGPDAGEPLVCVASVLGHVDEATGKRMSA